ncbi:helicase-related protein [Paenibacillus kyungheensis]
MTVKKKWLNLLDPNKVILYPLQFANVERLHSNDAVYIFDEVGSGKTISSGIMALDFLERHPRDDARWSAENDVLVITTNALARPNDVKVAGQFLSDWFDKLPFSDMGYTNRVRVVNNHHSKFKQRQSYGLVIIDEAHLFLNRESLRYELLTANITAKKVVFLSATPIKYNSSDLRTYTEIAEALLKKKVDSSWLQRLNTIDKMPEDLICSYFDVKFPVTRYFKDTVKSLQIEGYKKTVARRYETQIWRYKSYVNKNEVLLEKIQSLYRESQTNRFVVFTRYVEREAYAIGKYLETAGFVSSNKELPDQLTYYIVTGRNTQELSDFSAKTGLPTVLILTYQIAEQGLNLPGYNHIINYHISAYPSALEQRYGRIDRLDSESEAIYNCFLLGSSYFDSNYLNFYSAVYAYLGSLLKYLPSRNTLLSPEILKAYTSMRYEAEQYLKHLLSILNDQTVSKLYDHLLALESQSNEGVLIRTSLPPNPDPTDEDFKNLFDFCREDFSVSDEQYANRIEAEQALQAGIRDKIDNLLKDFSKESDERTKVIDFLLNNNNVWDHIFYQKGQPTLGLSYDVGWIDPIVGCAEFISENNAYKEYLAYFNQQIKLPMEFKVYRDKLNLYFESAFNNNEFKFLYPEIVKSSYQENLKEYWDKTYKDSTERDKELSPLILENIKDLLPSLPVFRMIAQFKSELLRFTLTDNAEFYRDRFNGDVHVFAYAMARLASRDFGLSKEFYNRYFADTHKMDQYKSQFGVPVVKEISDKEEVKKVSEATNWLKLVYHLTRKETYICKLKHIYGETYTLDYVFTPKVDHTMKGYDVPLFNYFILRNSGSFRTWVENNLVNHIPRADYIWLKDYWSDGILNAVRK